jgi:dihydroflavonol-4-reductase
MRALVTGSNGFIGSALVEKLLSMKVEVTCLVRATSKLRWLLNRKVEFVYGELSDQSSLANAVKGIDLIFHLAGVTKARTEDEYFAGNTQGTINLLEASLRHGSDTQKVIYISSQAAGGPSSNGLPVAEECVPNPISIYGRSKLMAEKAVFDFSRHRPATIVRPPSVYGPRDKDVYVLFSTIQKGLLPMPGGGAQKVSLVHIEDLVEGIWLAGHSARANGRLYYITGDGEYDWKTIGQAIARALDKRPITLPIPLWVVDWISWISIALAKMGGKPSLLNRDKVLEMKQPSWLCSNKRAKEELGFCPKVGLEEGLASTAKWYREMGWL